MDEGLLRFRITISVLSLSILTSFSPFAWLVTVARFFG